MGDAGMQEEAALIHSGDNIDIDVLKVSHHGSKTSTSQLFLEKTTPALAVVSVGAKNKYGHPHQDTLARLRGVPLYRTDTQGKDRGIYRRRAYQCRNGALTCINKVIQLSQTHAYA